MEDKNSEASEAEELEMKGCRLSVPPPPPTLLEADAETSRQVATVACFLIRGLTQLLTLTHSHTHSLIISIET